MAISYQAHSAIMDDAIHWTISLAPFLQIRHSPIALRIVAMGIYGSVKTVAPCL